MQLEIKPITIGDKALLDRYFSQSDSINSEYTFTNMFMWQKSYNIRYAVIDGMLCIFAKHGDSAETVNFPLGDGDLKTVIDTLIDYFENLGQKPLIRLYNQEDINKLNEVFPDKFILTEDRASFDYVYRIDDLIELSGKDYHAKKNHINRFLAKYPDYEYIDIDKDNLYLCYEMFGRWCESKTDTVPGIDEQNEAVKRLFDNFDSLSVKGGGILADGHMVAFSIGEVLNQNQSTVVIHLEHADTDYQGSFPLINQQFLVHQWSNFKYVNREEDMGLPGLRRAKKSYRPCLMVKKHIASLKNPK